MAASMPMPAATANRRADSSVRTSPRSISSSSPPSIRGIALAGLCGMPTALARRLPVPPASTPRGTCEPASDPAASIAVPSPPRVKTTSKERPRSSTTSAAWPVRSVMTTSHCTPASSSAERAAGSRRRPRREAGFATRSARLIVNPAGCSEGTGELGLRSARFSGGRDPTGGALRRDCQATWGCDSRAPASADPSRPARTAVD